MLSTSGVHVTDMDGASWRVGGGLYASWSPDGARIAIIDETVDEYPPDSSEGDYLYTVAPNGTDRQVLVVREEDGKLKTAR